MNRDVFGWVALFSVISMVGLFVGILLWGVNNDYLIAEVVNVSQGMNDSGLITSNIMNSIDSVASENLQMANYFDAYWVLSYVLFFGGSIAMAYLTKQEDEFGFLGILFYGMMIFLFFFSVSLVFTNWLWDILISVVPNISSVMPLFAYWLEWAGIFTMIHLLLCIIANKVDLGIERAFKRKSDTMTDLKGEIL